ncbi:SusD/RagB family nutrient-binding outer membrane lipoprotein [Ekhidna sp.]|uniref:SusD/RagB family nutrient-binding outer membrane lipoprotein n=1 Tax=Ekhidna sp. TaxID=2608089 RepID=UPI003B50B21F
MSIIAIKSRTVVCRFLFTLLLTSLISCEDFIGGEITKDPNSIHEPNLSLLLPSVQVKIADTYGGFHSRVNCSHVQHVEPVLRSISYSGLFAEPERFNDPWNNFYASIFIELNTIQSEASYNGFNHYLAIANILKAFSTMMATDVWGDIPYKEAGLGIKNIYPKFDSQVSIYLEIHNLLDEAVILLNESSGGLPPLNNDLIYAGDESKWIKAAYAIKSRAYLHFDDYENALLNAQLSFSDRSENMRLVYPGTVHPAPWYKHNETRTGDFEFSPTLRNLMQSLNDTVRLSQIDVPFNTNHPYLISNFGVDLISFREIQFIIAEAGLETPLSDLEVHTAYLNGIDASFQELNLGSNSAAYQDYISDNGVDPGIGQITLSHVLLQKHISLFLQPESYSDWRRRNIPTLLPPTGPAIPVRWPYSKASLEFNKNAPPNPDIYTERVFWDKD